MRSPQPAGSVAAFGKVPSAGDFLRSNIVGEPVSSFEDWLTRGLEGADDRLGQTFAQAFLNGPIYAFIHRAPQAPQRLLAGVVRPSRDAVGRRYPFVVCCAFESGALMGMPHLLPLVLGDFLESVTGFATTADYLRSQSDLDAGLARAPRFALEGIEQAKYDYDTWLQSTAVANVWRTVYGASAPLSSFRAIHTIDQCVTGFRGQEMPNTPLGLRVPLGVGGPAAAAFWIDVVRTIARWKQTIPSCFWSFDGREGNMLLHFGDPPARTVSELWVPDADSDNVCDLTGSSSIDISRYTAQLPRNVSDFVFREDAAVGHLMTELGR
ncbi:MAG: type VI secretion system-associated protein TagF [Polyangiales bacterium]